MKTRFLVGITLGVFLLALAGLSQAFPFWLNGPSRTNPNDPESPSYIKPFHAAAGSPTATPSNTVSPSQTSTFSMTNTQTESPTSSVSPTLTPSGTETESPTISPTFTATGTSTPTFTPVTMGATLPYSEYEAEAATSYDGELIGPGTTMSFNDGGSLTAEIAAESSGREAVKLVSGQSITFTTQQQCNSIVVRYIIPDVAADSGQSNATLSCYVNGTFNQELNMTCVYSWDYGGNLNYANSGGVNTPGYSKTPSSAGAFHLYDETHALLGEEVPAGSTISLVVGPGDTAAYYVIDFIDLEDVAAPLAMPGGFVSITSSPYNAVSSPYGTSTTAVGADCSAAIQACVNANTEVWIPQGNFACLSAAINVPAGVTIEGAGMWYSGLSGYYATLNVGGSDSVFSDFYLDGYTTNRDDGASDCGFNNGGGTGSSVTDVWVEHEKVGYWMGKGSAVSNGMTITGCRFRDFYADGVNINQGSSNCTVTQCNFRNTGDDSLASWSQNGNPANTNNTFSFNTIQNPWRADCFALYGGTSNNIIENVCSDTLNQSGIMIQQGFGSTTFAGTSVIENNQLIRAGGDYGGAQYGAIDLWGNQSGLAGAFTLSNIFIQSPTFMGVQFNGPNDASGGTFSQITINNAGTYGIEVESGTSGSALFSDTVVNNSTISAFINAGTMTINQGPGNSPNL